MKLYLTCLREAVKALLLDSEVIEGLFGKRVYVNRAEAWTEPELPAAGVYLDHSEPVPDTHAPKWDLRQASWTFEAVVTGGALEETLDAVEDAVHKRLLAWPEPCLQDLEKKLKKAEAPDGYLRKISWTGSDYGYVTEASETIGVLVVSFDIEYSQPEEYEELDDFIRGGTRIEGLGPDNIKLTVNDEVVYETEAETGGGAESA